MLRCAVILFAVFLPASLANWNDAPTGIDLDKLPHFPLRKLHTGFLQDGARIEFDHITATAGTDYDRQVRLRGRGKSGKPWEVHMVALDEVWRGDLDGNGTQDYVFFNGGPLFNGRMTPVFSMTILLMDADGMPSPFFTIVYKGENSDGIKHLLAIDGHAALLISNYDENTSDPHAVWTCSGHWVHQLYRFRNLGAEEMRGRFAGIDFPFIYNWSYGKKCSDDATTYPLEPAELGDESTTGPVFKTRLRSKADKVDRIQIDPVNGCSQIQTDVQVYDRPELREISLLNLFTSYAADLSEKIWRAGADVELRGLHKSADGCSVSVIWAK